MIAQVGDDTSERFRRWREYAEELETLAQDELLRQAGYEIYYAVDFSEIHRYAHPAMTAGAYYSKDEKTATARERMTLAFLFHQYGTLLVPDPYLIELDDHVRRYQALAAYHDLRKCALDLRGIPTVQNPLSNASHEIRQIVHRLEIGRRLASDDRRTVLDFVEAKYALLWSVQNARSVADGLERIRDRWQQRVLNTLSASLPDILQGQLDLASQAMRDEAAKIFRPIFNRRHSRFSDMFPNAIDALVAQTVKQLNEALNPQKQILVLISNDKTMLELGGWQPQGIGEHSAEVVPPILEFGLPDVEGKHRGVRGLAYVRAQIYAAQPSTVAQAGKRLAVDYRRVEFHRQLHEELVRVLNGLGFDPNADAIDDAAVVPRLAQMIDRTWEEIGRYYNVRSFLASNDELIGVLEADLSEVARQDQRILSFFKQDQAFQSMMEKDVPMLFDKAKTAVQEFGTFADKARDAYGIAENRLSHGSAVPEPRTEPYEYVPFFIPILQDYQGRFIRHLLEMKGLDPDVHRPAVKLILDNKKDPTAVTTLSLLMVVFNHVRRALLTNSEALGLEEGPSGLRTLLLVMRSCIHRITDKPSIEDWLVEGLENAVVTDKFEIIPLLQRERALSRWVRSYLAADGSVMTDDVLTRSINELAAAKDLLGRHRAGIHRRIAADLMLLLCWRNAEGDVDSAGQLLKELRMPTQQRNILRLPPMLLIADAALRCRWALQSEAAEERRAQIDEVRLLLKQASENVWLREWKRTLITDISGWLIT